MKLNCAEFEILLCDAVDGQLRGEAQAAFAAHRDSCAACREYAAEVLGAAAFLERVATVEPPKELITKILYDLPGGAAPRAGGAGGLRGFFNRWLGPVLAPKLAMGMAMTVLSLSMLASVFKVPLRPLSAADLDPVKIVASVEDQAHRSWNRAVKYYENLRLVFEIQSRLQEWTEQEEMERQNELRRQTERLSVPSPTPAQGPQPKQ
ncbi:MAG: hypothetical protein NTX13_15505 [Acidobacteria bacterium]|nr:hypothetical protein [Acidobacteriota bacterium]